MIHESRILYFDEVTSTNDVAKTLAEEGAPEGMVVVADVQTRGRGRLERIWFSPKGGLWFSIILKPKITVKTVLQLNFIASIAVAHAIQMLTGLKVEVKWPNDVLINGRKVCGILTEMSSKNHFLRYAIVGIGVNTNVDVKEFPEDLRNIVTSISETVGVKFDNKTILNFILKEFFEKYREMLHGKFSDVIMEWKSLAGFLGSMIEVRDGEKNFLAEALDVNEEGMLIVKRENGAVEKIGFGEISVKLNSR
jgi:BirA family biotin operon repressor/biotin-[acetyl-CoA-carboxylase] ligase